MAHMKLRPVFRLAVALLAMLLAAAPPPPAAAEIDIDADSPFLHRGSSSLISMDFQDAFLVDVLKIFSQQTKMNLMTSQDLQNRRVTMFLEDVPADMALEQLLKANGLTYELQPDTDIYIVRPLVKPDTEIITRTYPLKYASVDTSPVKRTVYIQDDDHVVSEEAEDSGSETQSTNGLRAALEAILTERGRLVEDPRTNSITVTDLSTNFDNIERTIARLDVPVPMILIEVEMLEITKNLGDQLGLKWGATPFVFTGAQRQSVIPFEHVSALKDGWTFEEPEFTSGSLDFSGLTATLQLLKTDSRTKSLARPRILTLNNQPAQLRIATNEAIGIKSQTSGGDGITASAVEAERHETGVLLTVTPQAIPETGEITMAVHPRVIIARTGSTFTAAGIGTVTFKDPEERGVQSVLRVHSGDTIVIGGLLREDDSKTETKVPFLGDIPFIGQAFRHKDSTEIDKELVIFITPILMPERPALVDSMPKKTHHLTREQDTPRRLENIEAELLNLEDHTSLRR